MAAENADVALDAGPLARTQRLAATLLARPELAKTDAQTRQAGVQVFCRRLLEWLEESKASAPGEPDLAARLVGARAALRAAAEDDLRGLAAEGLAQSLRAMLGDQYDELYGSAEPPENATAEYLAGRDRLDAVVVQLAEQLREDGLAVFDALLGSAELQADLAAWAWREPRAGETGPPV